MKLVRLFAAVGLMALSAGCFGNHPALYGALRSRASFDLDCPPEQIALTELDSRTQGVSGCGRRATYVLACRSNLAGGMCVTGTWVKNDATR